MDLVTNVLLPALVFFVMAIVGTGLTVDAIRRVMILPRAAIIGTLTQIVLLPALAVIFVRLTEPSETIAAGLLLLVTCPGGAISNTYSYLARANLALSVTLTTLTSALSVLTLPIALSLAFRYGLRAHVDVTIPVGTIAAQLFFLLLTPVAIGMVVLRRAPGFVERSRRLLQALAWIAVLAIVAFVFWEERASLSTVVADMMLYALGLTLAAMTLGVVASRMSGSRDVSDHFVMSIEFAVRNLPIATLIGVTSLGRPDLVVFSGAVFFAQTPILLGLVVWFRRREENEVRRPKPENP